MESKLKLVGLSRWISSRETQAWLPYAAALIILPVSAFLAYRSSMTLLVAILGLIFGIAGGLFFLRNLPLGVFLIIPASILINYSLGTGTQSSINAPILMIIFLSGLWLVDMVIIKGRIEILRSKTLIPLVLMVVVSLLAFLNGQLDWYELAAPAPMTAQIGGLMMFVLSAAIFFLVVYQIREIKWLERMVWIFIAIGAFFILSRYIPFLIRPVNRNFAFGSTVSLFWLWLPTLAISQGLFNQKLSREIRILLLAIAAFTMFYALVYAYDWKSGWVPPVASILLMIWFGFPKLRGVAVFGGLVLVLMNTTLISEFVTGEEDYTVLTRVEAWRIMLEIIKTNPFLGLGPANYYWYTPLYPILGYSVSFNSHNNLIDIVAQIGIFGLIFFLWFFWEVFKTGIKTLEIAPVGFPRAYAIGAVGGLGGTLVAALLGDWVIPFVYNVGLVGFRSSIFSWIFLGGLVALYLIIKEGAAAQANTGALSSS
jgi:hypothetical protein